MVRRARTEDRFRERLKTERERRDWSQAYMAELLSQEGFPFYGSTIAKIEAGDRAVSVAEAAAFAGIFGVSLDSLLGRNVSLENDLTYAVHTLQETARHAADQIRSTLGLLAARADDVAAFEFDDRDVLLGAAANAARSLFFADQAFATVRTFGLPADLSVTLAEEIPSVLGEILVFARHGSDPEESS